MATVRRAVLKQVDAGWVVDVAGLQVTQFDTEWALTVGTTTDQGKFEIRIENTFTISRSGQEDITLDPDNGSPSMHAALPLQYMTFQSVTAGGDGSLDITFKEDCTVHVAHSDEYEAWTLTAPHGAKLISMPGGEVATWMPNIPNDLG